jgi:hypothetical protein
LPVLGLDVLGLWHFRPHVGRLQLEPKHRLSRRRQRAQFFEPGL